MAKALCKWKKKDIEKNIHELASIVDKPRFICKDCARCAHDKGFLCKPIKLTQPLTTINPSNINPITIIGTDNYDRIK